MKFALINNGIVQGEADETTLSLPPGPGDKPLFDIRDVSGVAGIAPGWIANSDGTYSAPEVAPEPPTIPATQLTFIGFRNLFSSSEQVAIVSSDNAQIRLFCLMAAGANFVDLEDPRTVSGTNELETLGLIGKGRAAQVLSGKVPVAS